MRVARMIIVDAALEAREAAGHPVRVAIIGAGFMARGVAVQIVTTASTRPTTLAIGRRRSRPRERCSSTTP
jgi:predicted homoserine dehydrogenase-like protein